MRAWRNAGGRVNAGQGARAALRWGDRAEVAAWQARASVVHRVMSLGIQKPPHAQILSPTLWRACSMRSAYCSRALSICFCQTHTKIRPSFNELGVWHCSLDIFKR